MAETQQVIIEFVADPSGLAPAVDKLEALGTIDKKTADTFRQTNSELKKKEQALNSVSNTTKKASTSLDQLRTSAVKESQVIKMSAEEFKKTGLTLEQLVHQYKSETVQVAESTEETNKQTGAQRTLRAELREMTQQLAELKLQGKTNTEQYQQLAEKAGQYRDALGDVQQEINKTASDTRKLDTMIEVGQGIAASFTIAQGATALFGDENKDLQEVLVRVTSAMAVLNSLQIIGNLLQKESNIIRAISNAQLKLQVVQTNFQTAAQSKNIVVSTAANVAMKVLNATMKANPALILVTAFAALAGALALFSGRTKQAKEQTELLNLELERQNDILNKNVSNIDFQTKLAIDDAKKRNATEKELHDITIIGLKKTEEEYKKSIQRRISTANQLFPELGAITVKSEQEAAAGLRKLQAFEISLGDNINKGFKERLEQGKELLKNVISDFQGLAKTGQEIRLANADFEADEAERLRQKQNEAAEKRKQDLQKQLEEEKKLRHKGFEDFVASIDVQLLGVKKGTQEELELQKDRLRAVLQLDLDNEELTKNQRLLLVKKYFADRDQLEDDFFKDRSQKELENLISTLNAELTQLNLSASEREKLTTDLLNRQRALELAAVDDNKAKQKEINAKFDKEIADQSVAIFKSALDQEERLLKAQRAPQVRKDTKTADDPNTDIHERIAAIDRLLSIELDSIRRRKELNAKLANENKISQKEAATNAAELADEEVQAVENAEDKKRNAYKQTDDLVAQLQEKRLNNAMEVANQQVQLISMLFQLQNDNENQKLADSRQRIQDLKDSGILTEKQEKERLRQLELEERRVRQRQAQREKDVAVFQAAIAIPSAYLKGLKDGGLPLAIIYGALALAQSLIIAAKPIPKFFRGKKDGYEGPGEVGDRGPELIQSDGKFFIAERPSIVWLKKKDIVYTHEETKKILEKPLPVVDKKVMAVSNSTVNNNLQIDYEKIGKEIGKHVTNNHLEIDEKGIHVISKQGNLWEEYLDKRRRF